jgi:hypothetical protein
MLDNNRILPAFHSPTFKSPGLSTNPTPTRLLVTIDLAVDRVDDCLADFVKIRLKSHELRRKDAPSSPMEVTTRSDVGNSSNGQ